MTGIVVVIFIVFILIFNFSKSGTKGNYHRHDQQLGGMNVDSSNMFYDNSSNLGDSGDCGCDNEDCGCDNGDCGCDSGDSGSSGSFD